MQTRETLAEGEQVTEVDFDLPRVIEHLSASQISDYLRCPASWYLSRIAKLPQPPVAAIQVGLAVHRGLTAYHRNQDDEVELVAAWKELVTANVAPGALQRAIAAQALYRSMVKPLPIDVADWWFKVQIDGIPVPLIGAFDLVRADAQDPDNGAAWDWKTGKGTNWGQQKADTEIQATAYWLAYTREAERPPKKFVYVVIQTDRGDPWIKPFTTYRTEEQVAEFEDLCRDVYQRMLNDPVISTCPRGWCRYPEHCGRER